MPDREIAEKFWKDHTCRDVSGWEFSSNKNRVIFTKIREIGDVEQLTTILKTTLGRTFCYFTSKGSTDFDWEFDFGRTAVLHYDDTEVRLELNDWGIW